MNFSRLERELLLSQTIVIFFVEMIISRLIRKLSQLKRVTDRKEELKYRKGMHCAEIYRKTRLIPS